MAKPIQYCKVKIIIIKKNKQLKKKEIPYGVSPNIPVT